MSKTFKQNKYNAGDKVCAKVRPETEMIVRRYIDQIYYCRAVNDPDGKDLVYFERELVEDKSLAEENEKARTSV